MHIKDIMDAASVIPVLEIADIEKAAPLAHALAAGGLRVIELTLRTDCALDALKVMQETAPELIVGMGTVRTIDDVKNAAGAAFLVSPGATPDMLHAMKEEGVAALPGVATASEAMIAHDAGFRALKFFPAEAAGGINYLKSLAGPLPDITFCPTGGIGADAAPHYLKLKNVACVGGSWVATKDQIANGDWAAIEENARKAASFKA